MKDTDKTRILEILCQIELQDPCRNLLYEGSHCYVTLTTHFAAFSEIITALHQQPTDTDY